MQKAEQILRERQAQKSPVPELGFFGGTFTALPEKDFFLCLNHLQRWRAEGLVAGARCSTRPDAVLACSSRPTLPSRLNALREAGLGTVELGVQSFDDAALAQVRRGYDGATARAACEAVRGAGLHLGVQLLPGMPGVTSTIFLHDVHKALESHAHFLRFYPCLVLEDTELAQVWQSGKFFPWELAATVDALAEGWLLAQQAHVPVVRMGLAPEPGLQEAVLAGPQHPALGSMVQGEALCRRVEGALRKLPPGHKPVTLHLPALCRGFFWGYAHALAPRWAALGLDRKNVFYYDQPEIQIAF